MRAQRVRDRRGIGFWHHVRMRVGDLLAAHVTGGDLPEYAPAFDLARYDDPEYQRKLENWGDSGQL